MSWKLIVLTLAWLGMSAATGAAQACLHGKDEAPDERERRQHALAAVRIVNTAEANRPRVVPLAELADSPAVRAMRAEGGAVGEAARTMRFDREEVLPGWRVHFVYSGESYSLALQDTRDTCGFTYVSSENGAILQAYPITRGRSPLLPTTR